jgi:hypothetical protein
MRLRNKLFWKVSAPKYKIRYPSYLKVLENGSGIYIGKVYSNRLRKSFTLSFAKPRTKVI